MYGKSRRALMLITVFLVSIMSPLTTPIEPVEAHFDPSTDPPIQVQVYINKIYSDVELDDGWWLGGDAEIIMFGKLVHENHTTPTYTLNMFDWNMDGGFFTSNPESVTISGEDVDGEQFTRTVYVYDLAPFPELIHTHIECTPRSGLIYDYKVVEDDKFGYLWWWDIVTGVAEVIGGTVTTIGGVAIIIAGAPLTIAGVGIPAAAAGGVATGVGVAGVYEGAESLWGLGLFDNRTDFTGTGNRYYSDVGQHAPVYLADGVNYLWPDPVSSMNEQGQLSWTSEGIGVEAEVVVTSMWPDDNGCPETSLASTEVDSDEEGQSPDYVAIKQDIHDGFYSIRSAYAGINESTRLTSSTDLIGSDGCDQVNGTGDCDDWNNSQKPPDDPLNNTDPYNSTTHSVDRGLLMTYFNEIIQNATKDYLTIATEVNPSDVYEINMDLWYANFLTEGGHYFDALNYYESAIIGSINAIETAPPPPPAMVTVQAGGDEVPEDLFIEIYSGDCGDDCDEGDLVFVGDEGDSEIETALESGEYTVVMISDGDVYSSEYLEVLSGDTQSLVVGVSQAPVLDTLLYVQGMLIAAIPALIGFTGSRRYIEGEQEEFEGRSATPLWIGTAIFICIFYMIIG